MANKQSFSPEDWTKILESVALSGVAVTAADPSGLMGLMKDLLPPRTRLFRRRLIPVPTSLSRLSSLISRLPRAGRGSAKR